MRLRYHVRVMIICFARLFRSSVYSMLIQATQECQAPGLPDDSGEQHAHFPCYIQIIRSLRL